MAAASSSVPLFGILDEDQYNNPPPPPTSQSLSSTPTSSTANLQTQKKKRNLPGNPNPDAEVIALSPRTLLATNRFICEVCNKGFQREQNLQLHRRGHNLPWKLKQKNPKEVRRKVYLCPEPSCVHHDPSRALGDLTGIKKHYCRKHGEKKWKCDKCSKRYAVQSDWKAHSKTCGTREYRCDCGTLFSRRDSFITHRAFCDALAQESARLPTGIPTTGGHLYGNNIINLGLPQVNTQVTSLQDQAHPSAELLRLGAGTTQFDLLGNASFRQPQPPFYQDFNEEPQLLQNNKQTFHPGLMQLQDLHSNTNPNATQSSATTAPNFFNLGFFQNTGNTNNINNSSSNASNQSGAHLLISDQLGSASSNTNDQSSPTIFAGNLMNNHNIGVMYNSSARNESVAPQMSATALLQKAAQMGATSSNSGANGSSQLLRGFNHNYNNRSSRNPNTTTEETENQFQDLMNSLANGNSGMFSSRSTHDHGQGTGFGAHGLITNSSIDHEGNAKLHRNVSDRLTRDFLGVGSMMRNLGNGISTKDQQHLQCIEHRISLDSEMKSVSSSSRSFGGGSMQ